MKKILTLTLLISSTAIAQEKWDYKQDVVFAATHDPSMVHLKDGRKLEVFYGPVKWEELNTWKAGRAISIAYNLHSGVVLFDPASGKKVPILSGLAEHPIDILLAKCLNVEQTTHGMSECYGSSIKMWDKALNQHYSQLTGELNAKGKEDLKQAQRAWLKFRDLQITAIASVYSDSGTMRSISGGEKVMQLTKDQALRLASMVNR